MLALVFTYELHEYTYGSLYLLDISHMHVIKKLQLNANIYGGERIPNSYTGRDAKGIKLKILPQENPGK